MKKHLVICLGLSVLASYSHQMIIVVDDKPEPFPFDDHEPFIQPARMEEVIEKNSNEFIKNKINKNKPRWMK